jgi:superfamily II DNA/RNA helicase
LPSFIVESKNFNAAKKDGVLNPFDNGDAVIICSYQFGSAKSDYVQRTAWDLVVFDEAHKLRNVHKKDGSVIAKRLRASTSHATKLLLTATPLQNSLMELFGLVSVIDEHFFGSEQAFKSQYVSGKTGINLPVLKNRMKAICQRTLRKQAQDAGMAKFTKRYLITENFTPSSDELKLYDTVSEYLQRPEIKAMSANGRHLVTLAIRKILASSSFAIGGTLRKMIDRLESKQAVNLEDVNDIETIDETAEELEITTESAEKEEEFQVLKDEIAELKAMRELALGIRDNAKGACLVMALGKYLDSIVEKGGNRKAVIFTESVRTQAYLKELLTANGYDGKIALLNGSNSDPSSQELYKRWREKHKGTDALSGSKSADMKAAVVEEFKNDATILIATESGAEGINLQFCSLLINYDLPWNPQRVEQRIGRCHRYGQKLDVAVLNFINKGNRAEERVFDLLNQKFQLFEGVFGSSDQVLSAIESGVDIEQKIFAVMQKCRNAAEIDAEFDRLQIELRESIEEVDENARQALLQAMDVSVVERLKMRKENTEERLTRYDRYLLMLTKSEIPEAKFVNPKRFEYQGETYSLEWPAADENGWNFYRIAEGTLADELVQKAKDRAVNSAQVCFNYSAYDGEGQLSDLQPLRGSKGHLYAAKLTITNAVSVTEHVVLSGVTDDGTPLHPEMLHHLLLIPGKEQSIADVSGIQMQLQNLQKGRIEELFTEAEGQNLEFLNEETEKLDRWEEESTAAIDAEIKELRKMANDFDKQSRNPALAMKEKLALKRQCSHYKGEATKKKKDYFEEQEKIANDRKEILDQIEQKLEIEQKVEPMFTLRWELI